MFHFISKRNFTGTKGFTLAEVLVGTAVFLMVSVAAYSIFVNIFRLAYSNQARVLAIALADEQFEIIRNMPYTSVGLNNGIPLGVLPQTQNLVRGGVTFTVLLAVRNINLSTSSVQASDKLVEIDISCGTCRNFEPVILTGQISPANLQSAGIGGAVVINVFDANGLPVDEASTSLQSIATSSVKNSDVTNNFGILNVIGVPAGSNMYRISASKPGYSTDRTYPLGGSGNPNPSKPDATVLNQQVTQVSFAIDRLSTLQFSSVSPLCVPTGHISFGMTGAKTIGVGVPKYVANLSTDGTGNLNLNNMEWDTYTMTPTAASYDVSGINPSSPFALNPGNVQNVQIVVVPKDPNSLMVTVEDISSHLPVSGADVQLTKTGYNVTMTTGKGYISQTDWSLGSGQDMFTDSRKYFSDNGFVDTATSSGDIYLDQAFGLFDVNATGTLESSTFDTGTSSNFYTFSWTPASQPALTGANSVKFQFAASPSSTPSSWDYFGPDGTINSYFTVPGSSINSIENGDRYVRYKSYMTTNTATVTPRISDVSFAYTSGCIPPGQVLFQGLSAGSYTLSVVKAGYTTWSGTVVVGSGWQQTKVILQP